MLGIILGELQRFGPARLGESTWARVVSQAGLDDRIYIHTGEYPDQDVQKLVASASRLTGRTADALLQDFGEFLAPGLLRIYGALLRPEWRTLEVIEHTEESIHTVVRMRHPGAQPPALKVVRRDRDTVVLTYSSPRKLCALAKGISRGIASEFREEVTINEHSCMLKGDPACEISVRRVRTSDLPR